MLILKKFHATTNARKKWILFPSFNGIVVSNQNDICSLATNYFESLYACNEANIDANVEHNFMVISSNGYMLLITSLEKWEFKDVVFQMHYDKSIGPYGFNVVFYKRFWDLLGDDIFHNGVVWLKQGLFPQKLNNKNIALIPKLDNPSYTKDLRHISLCNVLYKIVSKVLANRWWRVLPNYISKEQLAFVERRFILDNVLVAIETIHHIKCKVRGKEGEFALKIDIRKLFDKVDWRYLQTILLEMGFDNKWVSWTMVYMDSLDFNVLVHKEGFWSILPRRRLR